MALANIDLESIKKQELFSSLRDYELDFVVSHSSIINLQKSKLLFCAGEKASQFYILTSGEIRVFKKNDDGSEEEMARFTGGDTIGDFDFARGAEYDACAEAAKNSQLIVFPSSPWTMESLAQEDANTVCSILLNAIIMMTGRIKSTRKLILENMSWVQELHRRAYEDPGTGLWKQILIKDEIAGVLKDPSALIMLKPDRFKILVDSNGHSAGDEAMIRIAIILKNITRIMGHGWALRFKSNEVGLIINNCYPQEAKNIAEKLAEMIAAMESVTLKTPPSDSPKEGETCEFDFSATVTWAVWPKDDAEWDSLFSGSYALLLSAWKDGGRKVVHYSKNEQESEKPHE
ncbi:MAG: cyclic nucleotide-binding domain-containing protein [Treponema sp.]|nr:cyclic nucleotide-binding domain-containing protein [Treponema sp.]